MILNRNLSISQMMFAGGTLMLLAIGLLAFTFVEKVSAMTPGDPANGKVLFEKRCTGCHALDTDKEGPRLRGVYGRKAGSVPGFVYSDALKAANFTWDAAGLDKWLTDTESVVPNNDMSFHVPKAEERADIIEYLRVSSGK
ncbi:MAG: c-type cytochrome [Acidobacteriaceae bacterium]|nr:c-type cytochrome [Acidobacteriaceae bacterium]